MDTAQMSYILALSKEDYNITKTAKRLFITQAALSKSLHSVEANLDVELFIREKGRLSGLSPAGKIFVSYAEQILNLYQLMSEELNGFSGSITGAVKIGIPGDIVDVLFYNTLPKLIMAYPSIQIDLNEGAALELEQHFSANELDILVSLDHNQSDLSAYERAHLVSQPYGVFLDEKHPLAACDSVTWEQIKDYPLALPTRSYTRMLVLRELMERNFSPHVAVNASSHRMLIRSVSDSQVITVLPRIFYPAVSKFSKGILWIPIKETIDWNVEILMKKRHRYLNDIVCRIYDCIRKFDLTRELPEQQHEA